MSEYAGQNLLRLMAERGMSIRRVTEATGLDGRTIRAILAGARRAQAQSLHRLAKGLGVPVDEFFLDPSQLLYRRFDRRSNPVIEEVLQTHRKLFAGWNEADFDELHSRVGTGGGLTRDGALSAVRAMNQKRNLHEKLDLLLESSQAELISGIMDVLHKQIVALPARSESGRRRRRSGKP